MSGLEARWKAGVPADRRRRRLNAIAVAGMVRLLQTGQPTLHDLVDEAGLCIQTVRAYVKALHKAGAVHIAGWKADGRGAYVTPRWALGHADDVARPGPIEQAVRMRGHRHRQGLIAAGYRPPTVAQLVRPEVG